MLATSVVLMEVSVTSEPESKSESEHPSISSKWCVIDV